MIIIGERLAQAGLHLNKVNDVNDVNHVRIKMGGKALFNDKRRLRGLRGRRRSAARRPKKIFQL
jgi:hypothetical protein